MDYSNNNMNIDQNNNVNSSNNNQMNGSQNINNNTSLSSQPMNMNNANQNITNFNKGKKQYLPYVIFGTVFVFCVVLVLLVVFKGKNTMIDDFINKPEANEKENSISTTKRSNQTSIIYNNTYDNVHLVSLDDAKNLIIADSNKEKQKCENKSIAAIENRIESNYKIIAVNLCELDADLAKEIEKVIGVIYNNYPTTRGYLTNLTLTNASMADSYIAMFISAFQFASADTDSTYPWVFKTLIGMNSIYFLDSYRLRETVKVGSASGHFPKNTTEYSPVAHEFGHYLSFLSTLEDHNIDSLLLVDESMYDDYYDLILDWGTGNHSKQLIEEAYHNYQSKYDDGKDELAFRQSISNYAVAKDNNGNYIYDETIAEAFHDYYLNGDNAVKASLEIVKVLKEHLDRMGE